MAPEEVIQVKQRQGLEDSLVLVYCMACPLRCDFCCHPAEEYGHARMEKNEAASWIMQAAEIPSFKSVVITGGEPFLYYTELQEIVGRAAACGFPVRVVTAAHWAKSAEAAREKLLPLKECGLTELSVSTDPSHQVFVPAAFAEYAVEAAQSLGVASELAGVFWGPGKNVEDTVRVPPGVGTVNSLAMPAGRGRNRKVTPEDYRLGPERFGGCNEPPYNDITVYPDGNVYPCCAGDFNIKAGLSFGNLRQEPLSTILTRMRRDDYTRLIKEYGFAALYDLARFKYPEIFSALPDRSPYVSSCQLCAIIHSDRALMDTIQPVMEYAGKLFDTVEEFGVESPKKITESTLPV